MLVLHAADGPSFEKALLRARKENVEIVVRGRMTGRYRADLPANRTLLIRGENATFTGNVLRKDWRDDGNGRWSRPADSPNDGLLKMPSRVSGGRLHVTLNRKRNPHGFGLPVVRGGAPLLHVRGGKQVTLRNLSFDEAPLGGSFVRVEGTRNATLEHLSAAWGRGDGFVLERVGVATLRRIQAGQTGGSGVLVKNTGRLDWAGGFIQANGGPSVSLIGGRGHRLAEIQVAWTTGVGFRLAADATVENCDARLCEGGGAVVEGPVRVAFRNTSLDYNTGVQLLVRGPGQVSFRQGSLRTPPTGPADRAASLGTDPRGLLDVTRASIIDRQGRYAAGALRMTSRATRFYGPRPTHLGPQDTHLPSRT